MKYLLTILLSGKVTPAKKKAFTAKLEKILNTLEGKIVDTSDWGELPLAYKVGKETSGNFMHYALELEARSARQIKEKLATENDVARYLFVKE